MAAPLLDFSEPSPRIPTNLLLVDDNPQNLIALEATLQPLGQNLVLASSGRDALKHLLGNDFAAILLDVQMPGMDGFETAALIKERQRSRHIPILFLTALSKEKAHVDRGYSVGAVDYISKPFDPDILRSKVAVFVELFQKNERSKRQSTQLHVVREREVAKFKRASEARYQALAESMPQIVWTADRDGSLTYGNPRWFACAGIGQKAGRRLDWQDVLHPGDLAPLLRDWQATIAGDADWESEYRFGNAVAGYRWHLVRAIADRDERQGVASWIGTSTDIDDRKHAEQGLRLLADASTQLSSSMDYETALLAAARVAVPYLGDWCIIDVLDQATILRRIVVEHGDAAKVARLWELSQSGLEEAAFGSAAVIKSGKSESLADYPGSLAAHLDENRLRAVHDLGLDSCVCVPLVARGRVLGAMTFVTSQADRQCKTIRHGALPLIEDLAARCAAAVDAAQLYAIAQSERSKLEIADRAKDEFLATVSHELRTPLSAMLGWTRILRSGGLAEAKVQHALQIIERNAVAQAQLITDLLDVSWIATGSIKVDFSELGLAQVVEGAVEAAYPVAEAGKVALVVRLDSAVGNVRGDALRLQQVVGNLLANAIKFTPAGGRVEVELGRDQQQALLRITDSGRGIEPDFLPHAFERFRQEDRGSTLSRRGLGLGLAIVRHLVGLHDGVVSASSEGKDKGSTFTVTLPLLASPATALELVVREADHAPPLERPALVDLHVLIVEDDDDARELLRTLLEAQGARVSSANAVVSALELMQTDKPDVIVSDIGLPGEDGFAFIRRVRLLSPERGGLVPVIALTAYSSLNDRDRAIAAGFAAHLAKPFDPPKLRGTIARLTGRPTE
jgi:PAS domain S-box-containing protein